MCPIHLTRSLPPVLGQLVLQIVFLHPTGAPLIPHKARQTFIHAAKFVSQLVAEDVLKHLEVVLARQ